MKKILCLVFCIIFVLSLTACGGKEGKKNSHSIDVEYYANLGQINDVDYKLGDDVDETQKSLSAKYESLQNGEGEFAEEDEAFYYDFQSGEYTVMTDGNVSCAYATEDKDSGITHIVKYGDAYGFAIGTVSTKLRDTMSAEGFDATERSAKSGELFFLPGSANMDMTVLEYKFKENTVLFVFQENALSATVISK